MPLPVDKLTAESSPQSIRESINQSIQACMQEGGRSQEQCAAMAYEIARTNTGKELQEGTIR